MDIDRRTALKAGAVAVGGTVAGSELLRGADADVARSSEWGDQDPPDPYEDYDVHQVDQDGSGDFETIQAAVNEATARDLILIEPGVYTEEVSINNTPQLTLRGTSRSEVIIDGEFERYNGINTTADGTVVENLTARNHLGNGIYWTSNVDGYRGSYLTAYRNKAYGIYSFNSRNGRFEYCYASGCDDAGFYIGQAQPADAVITNCIAEHNAMGYSGTNAGGNLVIRDSTWRHNMVGIVPNTLDSQEDAPQGHVNEAGIRIENNHIHDNNNLDVEAIPLAFAVSGIGIVVAGGTYNDICDNTIEGHAKYGVAVIPIITGETNLYRSRENAVMRNEVRDSGRTDLALAAPSRRNAFADNDFGSARPAFIERRDGSYGDIWLFMQIVKDFLQADSLDSYPEGNYEETPEPDPDSIRDDLEYYEVGDREDEAGPREEPPKTPIGGMTYE